MASAVVLDSIDAGGRTVQGSKQIRRGTINLGSSYTTGGVAITAAQFEFVASVDDLQIGETGGLLFSWDKTNKKVLAHYPTGGATAPATAIAPKVTTGASTASAVDATTPNITAGLGKEVANTTDLSAATFTARFRAEGV